jgi:hypothetical protein
LPPALARSWRSPVADPEIEARRIAENARIAEEHAARIAKLGATPSPK